MRSLFSILLVGVMGILAVATPASSLELEHKMLTPDSIQWGDAPASLPPGAKAIVLFGDPSKEGMFGLRLKFPPGYRVPPHSHPQPEIATVISGTLLLGMGPSGDKAKANRLPAGSFFTFPPGMVHYGYADEEVVLQLNSKGPWDLNYVNPEDDPRKATQ